jgi:hypothetical protein
MSQDLYAPGGWDFPLLPWGAKLAVLSIGPEERGRAPWPQVSVYARI